MKVQDAKALVKKELIESGQALRYFEPENKVVARSGDECIVAMCDQWYLKYSNEEWTDKVRTHVETDFEMFAKSAKNALLHTIGWLGNWACSRTFGLGTKLPWDDKWMIESLSDYTIAHVIQGGHCMGDKEGPANISPEMLTDEFF